jgi:Domain of unknown function (DUF4166)/Saccharopine dehydrogenase NADP binding domain
MPPRRVLLIGGTGVFGQRLAAHLAGLDGLELTISSRNAESAQAAAARLSTNFARSPVFGIALDRNRDLATVLGAAKPWLVIDASGPFQGANYAVPRAALAAGAHVIDLADARDYITGYQAALAPFAIEKGRVALAGASSTPALSSAAVAALTENWRRVDTIDIAITPGGQSDVGRAVIEAILSYAGRPVPVWRDGRLKSGSGWIENRTMAIPGMGSPRVALVETADAQLLGPRHSVRSRVAFYAGLESRIEQTGLMMLARVRRHDWLGDLRPLIPLLLAARHITKIGTSDRGAMLVAVTGLDASGEPRAAEWSLLAANGDGPYVPTLPAAAAVRALLANTIAPGARPASDVLALAAIEAEMTPYAITTARRDWPLRRSIFADALGRDAYEALPERLRAFHGAFGYPVWRGRADVDAATGLLARLVGGIIGLPVSGRNVPVTVTVERFFSANGRAPDETWTRNFDGKIFSSRLATGRKREVTETFGPIAFTLGVAASNGGLSLPVTGWRFGGILMPRVLAPRSESREFTGEDGRFHFDVRISLPWLGLLAHYRGWLAEGVA